MTEDNKIMPEALTGCECLTKTTLGTWCIIKYDTQKEWWGSDTQIRFVFNFDS